MTIVGCRPIVQMFAEQFNGLDKEYNIIDTSLRVSYLLDEDDTFYKPTTGWSKDRECLIDQIISAASLKSGTLFCRHSPCSTTESLRLDQKAIDWTDARRKLSKFFDNVDASRTGYVGAETSSPEKLYVGEWAVQIGQRVFVYTDEEFRNSFAIKPYTLSD